ncbi:MAG: hypothetical protein AAB116_14510, partial [Candidatus Poribacteria bacterium]
MGVKPVFKLTTADGRFIKTTGNHPYLTKDGWKKVIDLQVGDKIAVSNKISSQINGRVLPLNDYDGQYTLQSEQKPLLPKFQLMPQSFLFPSLLQRGKDNFSVGYVWEENEGGTETQALKLQPGLSAYRLSFPFLYTSLFGMNQESGYNKYYCDNSEQNPKNNWELFKEISCQTDTRESLTYVSQRFGDELLLKGCNFHVNSIYHAVKYLSSEFFIPEAQASVFPSSSDILWSRIVSIDYIGYEHVYDIEVEGTHNFVAGNWIETSAFPQTGRINPTPTDIPVGARFMAPEAVVSTSAGARFIAPATTDNELQPRRLGVAGLAETSADWVTSNSISKSGAEL